MDESDFLGRSFRFGCFDASVFSEKLTLADDGKILDYDHPNERTWAIENDRLVFKNEAGEVSNRFSMHWADASKRILHGEFVGREGNWHILKDVSAPDSAFSIRDDLEQQLYCGDIPNNFADLRFVDDGYPHTNLQPEIAGAVLDVVEPTFWLEAGSMIGGSAIVTADQIKKKGCNTHIVCIDPFVGDVNMWAWERQLRQSNEWQFLRLKNGKPTIFDRFLANILDAGHSDIILPIATTATIGTKLLRRLYAEGRIDERPQVIYLDSAHEPGEVFIELLCAWELLAAGGVLFGDDWSWPAVKDDVVRFSETIEQNLSTQDELVAVHSGLQRIDNVLLHQGQWVLTK